MSERTCFTCHNLGAPVLALSAARDRGFKIDDVRFKAILAHRVLPAEKPGPVCAGKRQGGHRYRGWALWTLEIGGWKADETTAAVATISRSTTRRLLEERVDRPPRASPFTTTFGIAAIRTFAEDKAAAATESPGRANG
jgi:hypothetical protein